VIPLRNVATGILADVIRRQPPSPARTAFAWEIAVGPALARTAAVSLTNGVLTIRARDARWAREIARAEPTILERMRHLLGAAAISGIKVDAPRSEHVSPRLDVPR
jgi:hypothetical protein